MTTDTLPTTAAQRDAVSASAETLPTPARLRRLLFGWYAAASILIVLGLIAALHLAINNLISTELDLSLRDAAEEFVEATEVRLHDHAPVLSALAAAAAEIDTHDRSLYLFNQRGTLVWPDRATRGIASVAANTIAGRTSSESFHGPNGQHWRTHS